MIRLPKIYLKNRKQLETYSATHLGVDMARVEAQTAKDTKAEFRNLIALAKVPVSPGYVLPMLVTV